MANKVEKDIKVSYLSKEEYICPVCDERFHHEELLSGSGRLIAGKLTDELHRNYEPSAKFGLLYPLSYVAVVCPRCLFASMDKADFNALPKDMIDIATRETEARQNETALLSDNVNFYESRTLITGAVSQYLVLRCYDYYNKTFSPTIKQAVAAIRAGWLFDELNITEPNQNWDWLAVLFKKKAGLLYSSALKLETSGKETISAIRNLGPDTDNNYGYEGLLYMAALLEYKYGNKEDGEARYAALDENKRNLAKMFGMGKSSKSKPGPLLEKSKALYDQLSKDLNQIDA